MFITYSQKNSGGYFLEDKDDGIAEYVIIEGNSLEEIRDRASDIFSNYRESCPCCGDRWDVYWNDKDDLTKEPEIYGTSVFKYFDSYSRSEAYIHYLDGSIKHVIFKEEK